MPLCATRSDLFLDGHVRAFEHFGAVPQRIAYDNLKAAVAKILVGSERILSARFEAIASHYLFEPSFCRPRTGHDKGGVESRGKAIRWQHLVPIPSAPDLATMRTSLQQRLDATFADKEGALALFTLERTAMLPLATHPFRSRAPHPVGVTTRSLVKIDGAYYSVPSAWAGLDVIGYVGADDVDVVGPSGLVTHPRMRFGERSIDYRHYIRELAHKPQAVRQVAAELIRDLGEPFGDAWRSLLDAHGPKGASRIFAKVLAVIETRGIRAVADTVRTALVDNEPLLLALMRPPPDVMPMDDQAPIGLRSIDVVTACAADYDTMLRGGAA